MPFVFCPGRLERSDAVELPADLLVDLGESGKFHCNVGGSGPWLPLISVSTACLLALSAAKSKRTRCQLWRKHRSRSAGVISLVKKLLEQRPDVEPHLAAIDQLDDNRVGFPIDLDAGEDSVEPDWGSFTTVAQSRDQ